jgi:signal transduction histidine kinase
MGERAHDLGGTFEIGPGESGGTTLIWRVPITS